MLAECYKVCIKSYEFLEATASELFQVDTEMLIQAIESETVLLKFIAFKYKTQEIREKAAEVKEWTLYFVPD